MHGIFAHDPILYGGPKKCVRVKQFDRACIVQTLSKLRRDREFNRTEIILELRNIRSADDG